LIVVGNRLRDHHGIIYEKWVLMWASIVDRIAFKQSN
jgi:hypothetical protein